MGWGESYPPLRNYQEWFGQQNADADPNEEWADMFMYWVYNAFDDTVTGTARADLMDTMIVDVLDTSYRRNLVVHHRCS